MERMNKLDFTKRKSLGLYGLLSIIKIELMAFKNNIQNLLNELITPILSYIFITLSLNEIIGDVLIDGIKISYINYTFIGIIARLTFDQMYTTVYRVIIDRKYNLLSYKYYMGVESFYYVVGMSFMPMLTFILQSFCLYLIGSLTGVNILFKNFIYIMVFAFSCQVFWCGFGIMIALITKNYKTRDFILNVILIPLAYASPVFYVLDSAPAFIKYISIINPLTYQMMVMRSIVMGNINYVGLIISILGTLLLILIVSQILKKIEFKSKERK